MKKLIPLFLIVALPILASSQTQPHNHRWMYVTVSDDNTIMLIDTIKAEIKQDERPSYYPTHAVTFWVMMYRKDIKNKIRVITKHIEKVTADTIKNQYESSSSVTYKNNKVVDSDDTTYDWRDVIPGTVSEEFIKFAKSVNNTKLRLSMMWNALNNSSHFPPLSPTE